jgi:outer membrane protein OmpA-like peptidoglycan-associated protein
MRRTLTTGLVGGFLALTAAAWAQEAPPPSPTPAGETATTAVTGEGHGTVTREEVRTWAATFGDRDWEVHPATPNYEGGTGLFHMPTAYSLPKGKWSFSIFRDNIDRDPKDIDFSIHGFNIGVGLNDNIELAAQVGVQNRVNVDALFEPGFYAENPFAASRWETGFGDIRFSLKWAFLDDYDGDPVGLAIRPWFKIGTADEELGLGTGKPSYGADLLLSKGVESLDFHLMAGWYGNSDPDTPFERDIPNAFRFGAGINIPACTKFQVQAEIVKTIFSGEDSDVEGFDQTNPLDFVIGPVIWFSPGIFIRPAISWNLNFDDSGLPGGSGSSSKIGRHISIGYHPGWGCREIAVPPPPPPPPPANANPTVDCEVERANILPGESVGVRATASDPDGDTLSYEWTTTAGQIVGSGPSVTFQSTGMTAPASATITVTANDGRGGSGSDTCAVNMGAAERRAEAITCVSGGFPRNSARLNNVDKACLDDVASRLGQDPRSRVIIVGHADSSERYPEVIARQRAEAAKAYLVRDRGVEESRVTVRSAAATKALDTGTDAAARARNRRAEVIFVPEGAAVPEDD